MPTVGTALARCLKQGELPRAETALLQAYRIRKLHHLELDTSYRSLGRLRLAQGDLDSAPTLLDHAAELAVQAHSLMPTSDIFHSRALVHVAQGHLSEALSDLRIALRVGRAWRWAPPANDTTQIGAEGMLENVHSALVDVGTRLYLETRERALVHETFTANEENRAASLRTLLRSAVVGMTLPRNSPHPIGRSWPGCSAAKSQHCPTAAPRT